MQRDTDYAIGTYADVSKIKILDSAVEDLYHGILAEAVEDGREPDEAKSLAGRAVISLVSKKLDNLINPRPRG